MDRVQSLRWTVLLVALGLTLAATVYPVEPEVPLSAAEVAPRRTPPAPSTGTVPAAEQTSWIATDINPFAPQGWQQPPLIAETAQAKPSPEPVLVEAPAQAAPPPLPYKFMGQMNDGNDRVIYLGRGEQVVLARVGDVLENAYKVIGIGAAQIDFESLSSGAKQSLTIPAGDN